MMIITFRRQRKYSYRPAGTKKTPVSRRQMPQVPHDTGTSVVKTQKQPGNLLWACVWAEPRAGTGQPPKSNPIPGLREADRVVGVVDRDRSSRCRETGRTFSHRQGEFSGRSRVDSQVFLWESGWQLWAGRKVKASTFLFRSASMFASCMYYFHNF